MKTDGYTLLAEYIITDSLNCWISAQKKIFRILKRMEKGEMQPGDFRRLEMLAREMERERVFLLGKEILKYTTLDDVVIHTAVKRRMMEEKKNEMSHLPIL